MTFPTTGILDTFTGTNGTDLHVYSANWQSPVAGVTALEIQSNAATGTVAGGVNWQIWATAYGPSQEVYATLTTVPATGQYAGLFTRVVNESSASTTDGYFLRYLDGVFTFYRVDNGAQTAIGAGISQTMSNGDSFGIESVGGTHTIYYKASGGSWTSLGTRSDSTYTAAGKLCLITGSTAVRFDNLGGGTLIPTLVVAKATHSQAADAVVLVTQSLLSVADSAHSQAADNLVLTPVTGSIDLIVAEALSGHIADSIALTSQVLLAVADSNHAQATDSITLSLVSYLTVQDSSHQHLADNIVLSLASYLVVQDSIHALVSDEFALTSDTLLVVADSVHSQSADNLTLTVLGAIALLVQDASHGHVADSVVLYGMIVWPYEWDVRLGVTYGPTGTEYTGTYAGGSGLICIINE